MSRRTQRFIDKKKHDAIRRKDYGFTNDLDRAAHEFERSLGLNRRQLSRPAFLAWLTGNTKRHKTSTF